MSKNFAGARTAEMIESMVTKELKRLYFNKDNTKFVVSTDPNKDE